MKIPFIADAENYCSATDTLFVRVKRVDALETFDITAAFSARGFAIVDVSSGDQGDTYPCYASEVLVAYMRAFDAYNDLSANKADVRVSEFMVETD